MNGFHALHRNIDQRDKIEVKITFNLPMLLLFFKATSSVPVEKCDLSPKSECRDISSMVPSLQPVEKCINIPKEVCSKVTAPRLVTKTQTRVFCSEVTEALRGNVKFYFSVSKQPVCAPFMVRQNP